MIEILDSKDDRIELYRSLRSTPETHKNNGILIAEGEKVVLKLLESGLEIISIFATENFFLENREMINNYKQGGTSLFYASRLVMKDIVGFRMHTGVMAMARRPEFKNIDELGSIIVMMNGIVDSENVGAIVRNCAAFGVDSLIYDSTCSGPYLRRAVRVSMGSVFEMKIHRTTKVLDTLTALKTQGYHIMAAELHERSININAINFPERFVLIFGSEAGGIQDEILNSADTIVKIPINENIRSINVAATSAVVLNKYYNEFDNKLE